jgi:hypothetical protein
MKTKAALSELASRGFSKPAKTLASVRQGLAESAAGLVAPRKRAKTVRTLFYPYDLYPYIVSGEIESSIRGSDDTYYRLKGFDASVFFRSNMLGIVSGERGQQIAARLKVLKAEHRDAERALKETYKAQVRCILPFEVPALAAT